MKLLATDYDYTLFRSNRGIKLNIDAIKDFKNKGNKFAIVTARSFRYIKQQIDLYNIPYDYISCNCGNTIFNSHENNPLISVEYLNNYLKNDIAYYLEKLKNKGDIKNIMYYNEYDCTSFSNGSVVEIEAEFSQYKNISTIVKEIQTFFCPIEIQQFQNTIFIKKHKTKSDAVREIAYVARISLENIFTVGDSMNDLEMIRDYNGYNMLFSDPILYKVSKGTVTSVRQLIKKINKWVLILKLTCFSFKLTVI